jgi:MFS family permease
VSASGQDFRVGSLTGSVYVPSLLFAIGQGAAIPMLPLLALDLGLSVPLAGAVVAARAFGTLLFDVPAGVMVARLGEKPSMLIGTGILVLAAVGVGAGPSPWILALLVVAMGAASSIWHLARLTYAAEVTPPAHRGRVMSMLGGLGRIGSVLGPLAGGAAVAVFGLAAAFYLQAAFTVVAFVSLAVRTEPLDHPVVVPRRLTRHLLAHVGAEKRLMSTVAVVSVAIQVLRSARDAFIPLWGDAIGISAAQVSIVFAVMSAAEVVTFYPAGLLSDRLGRKWSAIPCMALLSIGVALVPFTGSFVPLAGAALIVGIGNGLGAGIQMTLGSDLAPAEARAPFLGMWRLGADAGAVAGPSLIAGAASAVSLAFAAVLLSGVGLAGIVVMAFLVPETLQERARAG